MSPSCTSAQQWYCLESRQSKVFDEWWRTIPASASGVLVHNVTGTNADGSFLLDMTPATTSWGDASLPLRMTYTDPVSGLTITPTAVGSNASTVAVAYPPATCMQAAPSVALTPTGTQYSSTGATTTYTVNVTNNDSCNCAAVTFNIGAAVPAGWSATTAQAAGVAAGTSASRTISMTAAGGAAPAFYTIPVSATNAGAPSYTASSNGTIAIVGALGVTVVTDKSTYVRPSKGKGAINAIITTTVTSGGTAQSGAAVSVQVRGPSGATTSLSGVTGSAGTASVTYAMRKSNLAGTYTVTSTSTVGNSDKTASTTFSLQ